MSNRKALCVGINKFKNYSSQNLQGCVNDALDMKAIYKSYLGFSDSDITMLTDADATKAKIMSGLKEMVNGAKSGKYNNLVFSISSHGTQVPDTNNDESDRADEAFCPHDLSALNGAWDPKFIITDDELHDLFITLPQNVLLEVYLDTCHSGTGLKTVDFMPDRRPRYLAPPSPDACLAVENKRTMGIRDLATKETVHHILWAACRANQTSADAFIDGAYHGAFTYYWCKEMRDCKNSLSRTKILGKVRMDLSAGHYNQVPQLECEATKRSSVIMPVISISESQPTMA
jgi:hypothetical protein